MYWQCSLCVMCIKHVNDLCGCCVQFKPLEQLMGVFPAASGNFLPQTWRNLMSSPVSLKKKKKKSKIRFRRLLWHSQGLVTRDKVAVIACKVFQWSRNASCCLIFLRVVILNTFFDTGVFHHRLLPRRLCHWSQWQEICLARWVTVPLNNTEFKGEIWRYSFHQCSSRFM